MSEQRAVETARGKDSEPRYLMLVPDLPDIKTDRMRQPFLFRLVLDRLILRPTNEVKIKQAYGRLQLTAEEFIASRASGYIPQNNIGLTQARAYIYRDEPTHEDVPMVELRRVADSDGHQPPGPEITDIDVSGVEPVFYEDGLEVTYGKAGIVRKLQLASDLLFEAMPVGDRTTVIPVQNIAN